MPRSVRIALVATAVPLISTPTSAQVAASSSGNGADAPLAAAARHGRMLDLGGGSTEVIEWGRGEPAIVLIHGANSSPHLFDHFARHFSDRHRLVAYARRGHGGGTPPTEPFDLDDLVDDLRTVMDRMGLERVVLMGHSFGGAEITRFAALHPDRVAGLVYLDAHHEMNENPYFAEAMADPVYPACAVGMMSRDDFEACLRNYLLPPFPWSPMMDEVVSDMLVDAPGPPVYKTAAEHVGPSVAAIHLGHRREYEKVLAPALFVMSETYLTVQTADDDWNRRYLEWAESSGYRAAQQWWIEHLRDVLPGSRIVTIEGGTHDFIMEFQATIDEVERFLEGIGDPNGVEPF